MVAGALGACAGPGVGGSKLTVYAAASLTEAFRELGSTYEAAHAGSKVEFNFAGSQELRAQIEQGAKADVFASADLRNMKALEDKGTVSAARVFARNRLVVIVPADNRAGVKTLADLARPGLKLVMAQANVPVGQYGLQALDKLAADPAYGTEYKASVLQNAVSQENNVRAVVSKIALGEGDAGIVYATDAQSVGARVGTIEIPDAYNVVAEYPIAVVTGAAEAEQAKVWIELVLSEQGQAVLKRYGFVTN